jgi:hypothetical protein
MCSPTWPLRGPTVRTVWTGPPSCGPIPTMRPTYRIGFCTRPATCCEMCLTTANGQPSTVTPCMVRQVLNGIRVHRA